MTIPKNNILAFICIFMTYAVVFFTIEGRVLLQHEAESGLISHLSLEQADAYFDEINGDLKGTLPIVSQYYIDSLPLGFFFIVYLFIEKYITLQIRCACNHRFAYSLQKTLFKHYIAINAP